MKFLSTIIFVLLICFNKANALPFLPANFLMKPYAGIGFNFWSKAGQYDNVMGAGFDILGNVESHIGLRVHRNFGIEVGYSRFGNNKIKYNQDIKFNSDNFYADLLLYYPIFDILGTAIEVYANAGVIYMDQVYKINNTSQNNGIWTGKFGGGLQTKLFGASSVKFGVDYYHINYSYEQFKLPYIVTLKFGFDIYFL
jgi:hypothetical protein